jgi:hypothetical protein
MALRAVRHLDLLALGLALPVFLVVGLPLLGWGAAAAAWIAQRAIAELVERRAAASEDLRTVAGLVTGSMVGRGWLVALAIFGAGMVDREAGLSAAVLSIALFTIWFSTRMTARPFEAAKGGRGRGETRRGQMTPERREASRGGPG